MESLAKKELSFFTKSEQEKQAEAVLAIDAIEKIARHLINVGIANTPAAISLLRSMEISKQGAYILPTDSRAVNDIINCVSRMRDTKNYGPSLFVTKGNTSPSLSASGTALMGRLNAALEAGGFGPDEFVRFRRVLRIFSAHKMNNIYAVIALMMSHKLAYKSWKEVKYGITSFHLERVKNPMRRQFLWEHIASYPINGYGSRDIEQIHLTNYGQEIVQEVVYAMSKPVRRITTVEDFKGTTTQVYTSDEYTVVRNAYTDIGAPIWPWHQGYAKRDPREQKHHLYGWEHAGFMKQAGVFESLTGDFVSGEDLMEAIYEVEMDRPISI